MTNLPNKICIDFHGVLTNGKVNITSDGEYLFETVIVRDIAAIRELIAMGFEVYIITSSKSKIIDSFAKKVGCEKITSRIKDDLFIDTEYIALGDSAFDYKFLLNAYIAFCPKDAEDVLLEDGRIQILRTKGGDGCVYELLQWIKSQHEYYNNYTDA